MILSMGILGLTLWLFTVVPTGFIPASDSGIFYVFGMAEQSASFDTMKDRVLKVGRIFMADPDVFKFIGIVGVGGPNTSMNNVAMFPLLKPMKKRKRSAQEIIDSLRPKMAKLPDLFVFMLGALKASGSSASSWKVTYSQASCFARTACNNLLFSA